MFLRKCKLKQEISSTIILSFQINNTQFEICIISFLSPHTRRTSQTLEETTLGTMSLQPQNRGMITLSELSQSHFLSLELRGTVRKRKSG